MQRKGPARNLRKEREWRERVRRQERSGESVRAFCRREDLQESAFYAWRRELARCLQERQVVRAERKRAKPLPPARERSVNTTPGCDAGVAWIKGISEQGWPGDSLMSEPAEVGVLPAFDYLTAPNHDILARCIARNPDCLSCSGLIYSKRVRFAPLQNPNFEQIRPTG